MSWTNGCLFHSVEEHKCLNSELWHACAGPLVSLPWVGIPVVYFPQGHSEQDFTQQPPCQELMAKDLHGNEWKFRHIFRGQPKQHLLTTGWSVFVSANRLAAGDSVLFICFCWEFVAAFASEHNAGSSSSSEHSAVTSSRSSEH